MKTYKLNEKNYKLLKSIDFTEMGNSLRFNDTSNTFETNNIRLLQIIITEEIATKGLTDDQERCNDYGRELYELYDEIYGQ